MGTFAQRAVVGGVFCVTGGSLDVVCDRNCASMKFFFCVLVLWRPSGAAKKTNAGKEKSIAEDGKWISIDPRHALGKVVGPGGRRGQQ